MDGLIIIDPPEANQIFNDTIVFGVINGTAELQALHSLGGNPYPNVTWVDPSVGVIEFPHPRFDSAVDGVLKILQIQPQDFGSYFFTAENGIGNEIMVDLHLRKAST